jgi:hypothetical protein
MAELRAIVGFTDSGVVSQTYFRFTHLDSSDIKSVKLYTLTRNISNYLCINNSELSLTFIAPYIPRSQSLVSHFRAVPREE